MIATHSKNHHTISLYWGLLNSVYLDYFNFVGTTDKSNHNLQFYLDGMNEEIGEISGIFKSIRRGDYGVDAKHDIDIKGLSWVVLRNENIREDLLKEIGDAHWYMTRMLQQIKASWDLVETINKNKLTKREETNTILGRGDDRENVTRKHGETCKEDRY